MTGCGSTACDGAPRRLSVGYSILVTGPTTFAPAPPPCAETVIAVQGEGELVCTTPQARVVRLPDRGVARSRNAVLAHATGPYVIFGDDDIEWREEGVRAALDHLDAHPEITLVLGQSVDGEGRPRKPFPSRPHRLNRWNTAKAATYEMVVRIEDVRSTGVQFDENFGAGTGNHLGDEYAFIVDLLKAGKRGVFLPVVLAEHADVSSGMRSSHEVDAARAIILKRVHGRWAPLARLLFAARPRAPLGSVRRRIRFIVRPKDPVKH